MDTTREETSEFSINEVLYMGSQSLTYIVEIHIDAAARDPFDVVAEREEELGRPLALLEALINFRRTPM